MPRSPRETIVVRGVDVDVTLTRIGPVEGRPTVLVPGLAATPAPFNLHERRPLTVVLQESGRSPWLVDFAVSWRRPGQDAPALLHALQLALSELRHHAGVDLDAVDAVGHSLGGILLLALAADGVPLRRIATMGTALDYRGGFGRLGELLALAPETRRLRAPVGGLPVSRLARFSAPLLGRRFTVPLQTAQFHPGSTPGPVIREMMRQGVRDLPFALLVDLAALLTEGGLRIGHAGRPLREAVRDLTVPVLMIAGRQDSQCPVQRVREAVRQIPSARLLEVGEDAPGRGFSHVDLMTATRAPDEVFDPLVSFLEGA
ncbi:MAG: alpha/beta fold hydrolase [Deltaproteobacteria bacterium]|nr:MAG: alpha/beta fold hydrolase [Deltaproteobacteria bacterium]